MSYMAALDHNRSKSGSHVVSTDSESGSFHDHYRTDWWTIWSQFLYTHSVREIQKSTGSCILFISPESIPVATDYRIFGIKDSLNSIEISFGSSATNLAKILRVSRPMIYKYRGGMEPTVKNYLRLQELARFTSEWNSIIDHSFETNLKTLQPEGRSLLDFLSEKELDYTSIKRILNRCLEKSRKEKALMEALAEHLEREKPIEERLDILRERHAAGKSVYVGDPDKPGKLIQLRPDGQRIRGSLVNRKFIPDEQ